VDASTRELRRVSRQLLGSSYKLEVAAAIEAAGARPVYARQLLPSVPGARDNQIGECLKHFETAGLLKRNPTAGGREPQTFKVLPSAYWRLCAALRDEIDEQSSRQQ
jgi:hypothetical protein